MMAEDLRNYNLQLQQVEAALLTDPQNEELLKLKGDLEEVIELTQDLIKTQEGESKAANIHGSSNDDDVTASLLAAEEETEHHALSQLHVGDKCLAKWKSDGIFDGYTTSEVVQIYDIKPASSGLKRHLSTDESKKKSKRNNKGSSKLKKKEKLKKINGSHFTPKHPKSLESVQKVCGRPGGRAPGAGGGRRAAAGGRQSAAALRASRIATQPDPGTCRRAGAATHVRDRRELAAPRRRLHS
ncbi:hypothetical protein MSG28_010955 [Choristoneura fumiferana]|uniref:Uncharacterized protein n=1 Tax=Choristoneura fumiferana TaxID=7141 RepID=A0ACC0KQJ5_CHOFU|nr:hypothetical protein MSG28_010955 [Choristoneura fumiferana]